MKSFGIDLGGSQIKICKWNNDQNSATGVGAEIVENDQGKRSSVSRVSFKDLSFNICGQRSENIAMNIANNIWGFKPIVGSNDAFRDEMGSVVNVEDKDRAIFNVKYNGQDSSIDSEVVMSLVLQYCYYRCLHNDSIGYDIFPMELPKLIEQPHSVTIAVPPYYTTSNIRGLAAALNMRNLGNAVCLRENVAVALDYGYYKAMSNEFPDTGSTVIFCDMGGMTTTITVVHFTNEGLEILGTRSEQMGGVTLDRLLGDLLYQKCCEQFGETIERTERVNFKLMAAAEKVKKDMSAEKADDIAFVLPSMVDGEECEGIVTKEEFEAVCRNDKNFLDWFYHFVMQSVQDICGDRAVDVVETVGSTMRLPQLRKELQRAVEHCGYAIDKIGSTLNAEESCARGCALFSHLYFEDHSIACGEQKVVLSNQDVEVCSLTVCGCMPVEAAEQKFVLQCNEPLQEGVDHAWPVILKEGTQFMEQFVKNCSELRSRQVHRNTLEQHCSELRAILDNSQNEKPELRESIDNDRLLLESNCDLISSVVLQPTSVYSEAISTISDRLTFYRSAIHISPNRLRVNDVEYVGIWMNGHMTGTFDCFDLQGVHLYTAVFRDGVLHGKMEYFYASKKLKSIQHYKDGKLEGPFVGYYENGQLAESCTFKEDTKEGYWQICFENGQIAKEGLIKEGKNVFVNLYHRNGVIAYQHLYTEKGHLHSSYEFNRKGEMMYWGQIRKGQYSGQSLVFYRNQYYAVCKFTNGMIRSKKGIVTRDALRWSELDKQMEMNGTLDCSIIKWKPLRRAVQDVTQYRETTLRYEGKSSIISTMNYMTHFDILYKEKGGKVPVDDQDSSRYMTPEEVQKHKLYDSDIQEVVSRYYTLFGDLKSVIEFTASPVRTVKCTQYYPFGRNEVLLNNPEECRKRAEGEMKDRKASGHWVEYYNNGKVRCEGEKKDGQWVEKKMFLNTGSPME